MVYYYKLPPRPDSITVRDVNLAIADYEGLNYLCLFLNLFFFIQEFGELSLIGRFSPACVDSQPRQKPGSLKHESAEFRLSLQFRRFQLVSKLRDLM